MMVFIFWLFVITHSGKRCAVLVHIIVFIISMSVLIRTHAQNMLHIILRCQMHTHMHAVATQ